MADFKYTNWGRTRGPKNLFTTSTITPLITFPATKVMQFDGSGDYVEVADNNVFSFGNEVTDLPFSLHAWVQVDDIAADTGAIIGKYNANTDSEWLLWTQTGKIRLNLYDKTTNNYIRIKTDNNVLSNDTWHHVVATYDASRNSSGLKLYIDGQLVADGDVTRQSSNYTAMHNTGVAVRIGSVVAAGAGLDFEKKLTNIALFNVELTAAEALELYNQGKVIDITKFSNYSNTVAWWKLGPGDSLPTATEQIASLNGTITNATLVNDPGVATPGIFVTDVYTTENQRYLHLRITETGDSGAPKIKVWVKSYAFGIDRWAILDEYDGVQNSSVSHIINIAGADRVFFVWDNTGTNVVIAASCSTF